MRLAKSTSYERNKEHVGEVMEGFVTHFDPKEKLYLLRSYWNAPDDIDGRIFFRGLKEHKVGERVKVKIERAFVYDLMGEEVL